MLRYKCLVLDHADTAVQSTPAIHFPAFQKTLEQLRPGRQLTLEQFMEYSFEPGFAALCSDILGFTPEEMAVQNANWHAVVDHTRAPFWPGMPELVREQKKRGGLVCVASHSCAANIEQDYKAGCGLLPDAVFGWELGEEQRKPSPWPLREIMRRWGLAPGDLLMVDDLKPGYDMARACGVEFACAGWGVLVPRIAAFMRRNCDHYFESVDALRGFLFGG